MLPIFTNYINAAIPPTMNGEYFLKVGDDYYHAGLIIFYLMMMLLIPFLSIIVYLLRYQKKYSFNVAFREIQRNYIFRIKNSIHIPTIGRTLLKGENGIISLSYTSNYKILSMTVRVDNERYLFRIDEPNIIICRSCRNYWDLLKASECLTSILQKTGYEINLQDPNITFISSGYQLILPYKLNILEFYRIMTTNFAVFETKISKTQNTHDSLSFRLTNNGDAQNIKVVVFANKKINFYIQSELHKHTKLRYETYEFIHDILENYSEKIFV